MTLAEADIGQQLVVTGFSDEHVWLKGLRFGLSVGAVVVPVIRYPWGGPTVIELAQQRLALGHSVCRAITVAPRQGSRC